MLWQFAKTAMCIINSYRMSGVNNSDVDDDDDGRSHDDDDDEVNARNGTTLEESKNKRTKIC